MRVEDRECGLSVGLVGGSAVEGVPTAPNQHPAENSERNVVPPARLLAVLSRVLGAPLQYEGDGESCRPGGRMNGDAASKVHSAVHREPARRVPHPMRKRVVD